MDAKLIALTALVGFLGSFITYYLTKKQQRESEERKIKQEYYRLFVKALSDVAIDNNDDEAQHRLSESFNSLIVIASPFVVQKLMKYLDLIRSDRNSTPRDTNEWRTQHDELLRIVVKAIRKDIYGNEKDIDSYLAEVHLTGRKIKKIK